MVQLVETVTKHRKALHQIPELTFEEYKTTAYIREELRALDIDYMTPLETATVAYIEGNSAQTIGFRADIDALPIIEETGLSYSSMHQGAMHACGHDGHASMLLTFAEWCKEEQKAKRLKHNVLLIFQPSEETNGGANHLVKTFPFSDYSLKGIFGLHLMPDSPEGTLLTKVGPLTASATEYRIYMKGLSAHVAEKERGKNTIGGLNHVVTQISQLQQYFLSGLNQNVIHIGKINAGEAINTVASNAYLEGTIRTYDLTDLATIQQKIQDICESTDQLYQTKTEVLFAEGYPPVDNDEKIIDWAIKAAQNIGLQLIIKEKPYLFGEDFSFYQQVAKTNFAFLGVQNKEKGYISGLHTAQFNFDEPVLEKGIRYYQEILNQLGD